MEHCSRCGRIDSEPSGFIMEEKFPENEIKFGGICKWCMTPDDSYKEIPQEERDFGGWFMDMRTDDERTWFIRKRIELYGS
ncbi:MAG: hypothetical protein K0S93_93 [Nitrososphaeraceae archaeon]|nr:hypothetical protein [Nitrososphaeraceae archaeon]